MADLGAYQAAAANIYEPMKASEATQLGAVRDTTKNSLESQKGQVNTNYQDAIDQLTQSVEDQTGQINQLYSQRLGGNFSGLQGNDMGKLFSRANQQTTSIASTRANKLNEITTGQTNADINYAAGISSLTSKYQSLETQYAQGAYGDALKAEQEAQDRAQERARSQSNSDREYALSVAKFNQSSADAGKKGYGVAHTKSGGLNFNGPNGQPVTAAQYASVVGTTISELLGASQDPKDKQILKEISKGTSYDVLAKKYPYVFGGV